MLCLLVSIGFQVLFHSPPGVLFTFPSRYYTLSVTRSYLALGDGPPVFPPDSTCPVVLWILAVLLGFHLQVCHFLWTCFPTRSVTLTLHYRVRYPSSALLLRWFRLFPVRSPLLRKSIVFFLFLRVLRCFSSPGSLPYPMDSSMDNITLLMLGSPIRKSADHKSFALPRSLSQLVTSFFGA